MGGALILVSVAISTILWMDMDNRQVMIALIVTLLFGGIGFVDDFKKLQGGSSKGLSAKAKYFWQTVFGLGAALYIYQTAKQPIETTLIIPFIKDAFIPLGESFIPLGVGFIAFTYFVIVGSSKVMVAGALGVFAYVTGNINFANYLSIPYISGVGELVVFCGALVGAGLGFLWFNTYPAQVFMGDVGALALGAALGIVAVLVRQELVLLIMGGIFVMETISVILQVASFKLTGRRIFRMAPLHHHFELKGWPEPRVIVRFWIITVVLVLIGLASLKVR